MSSSSEAKHASSECPVLDSRQEGLQLDDVVVRLSASTGEEEKAFAMNDEIYDTILEAMYSLDPTLSDSLMACLNDEKVQQYYKKGYLLAHHVIQSFDDQLIERFIESNLTKLSSFLTKYHIFHTSGVKIVVVENQTILHLAAFYVPDLYSKLTELMKDTPDALGHYAAEYYEKRNDTKFVSEINHAVISNVGIKYSTKTFIVERFEDLSLRDRLLRAIEESKSVKPNSLHTYGHVLKDSPLILELVEKVDATYHLNLEGKVYEVSSFTAEYGPGTNNNLDLHKDNSTITINWNLQIDPEILGTELVFPSLEREIQITDSMMLIHHGKIEHYVKPLIKGSRINLIIWLQ